jgi:hypothetical protein
VPDVNAALEHCKFLISKGRGSEAAVLYLPRIEAQKRKANREKRKRIIWDVDEASYSRFNAERDRWIGVCVNKTVAVSLMCDVLAAVPEETMRKLLEAGSEERADDDFMMGRGETVGDA